jgi:hypothetical protein
MASYKITLEQAFWDFPLAVAMVLMPIYATRQVGKTTGPTPAQDAAIQARNQCRAFLKDHFTIVKDPRLPWQLTS